VTPEHDDQPARRTYSYLGPAGTFTEAALAQVPEARDQIWRSVRNVGEALADVVDGRSDAAMAVAISGPNRAGAASAAQQGRPQKLRPLTLCAKY
jgi:prephenate dehydratase